MLQNYFLLAPVPANKSELVLTKCNVPYVHPRLDSILELCQTFPTAKEDQIITFYDVIVNLPNASTFFIIASISPCFKSKRENNTKRIYTYTLL